MTGPEILGVLGGLGGIVAVVLALIQAVRNGGNTPEATWQAAIRDLKTELSEVKKELIETRKSQALYKADVDDLYGVVLILTSQLRENGIEPRVQPKPRRPGTGPLGQATKG